MENSQTDTRNSLREVSTRIKQAYHHIKTLEASVDDEKQRRHRDVAKRLG